VVYHLSAESFYIFRQVKRKGLVTDLQPAGCEFFMEVSLPSHCAHVASRCLLIRCRWCEFLSLDLEIQPSNTVSVCSVCTAMWAVLHVSKEQRKLDYHVLGFVVRTVCDVL